MKVRELSDWFGVITNVGVIAGLVLVAYEIRQNSIALDQQGRIAQVEVTDGLRAAWQNWEYAVIENEDVADIWMRGDAGEPLAPLEEFRYGQIARELFRLSAQNYVQQSTLRGEPQDWVIQQLITIMDGNPRLRSIFAAQLDEMKRIGNPLFEPFVDRVTELDPPELR